MISECVAKKKHDKSKDPEHDVHVEHPSFDGSAHEGNPEYVHIDPINMPTRRTITEEDRYKVKRSLGYDKILV